MQIRISKHARWRINVHQDYHQSTEIIVDLPYQVKTQYLQILNIIDTSIYRAALGQSTAMIKGCMNTCLIILLLFIEVD